MVFLLGAFYGLMPAGAARISISGHRGLITAGKQIYRVVLLGDFYGYLGLAPPGAGNSI
jgi:hypothetical protein